MDNEIIIKVDQGEHIDLLRDQIIELINNFKPKLNGYELIGLMDTLREDCHNSIQEDGYDN